MKKVISLILVIAIILLVGCAETTEANTKVNYIQDCMDNFEPCRIFVDKETGVNYIVYIGTKSCALTPRLNADGTPYVSGVNGNE